MIFFSGKVSNFSCHLYDDVNPKLSLFKILLSDGQSSSVVNVGLQSHVEQFLQQPSKYVQHSLAVCMPKPT